MTQVAARVCANCGDAIGRLERSSTWEGQPVCALCFAKLCKAATLAPTPAGMASASPGGGTAGGPAVGLDAATVARLGPAAMAMRAPAGATTPPPPAVAAPPAATGERINLRKMRGGKEPEVRPVVDAWAVREEARKKYSAARSKALGARIQWLLLGLRLGESKYGITPVVDAVILASVPTLLVAACLIFTFAPGLAVLAVILTAVHGAAIVLLLGLLLDREGEGEGNRVDRRRKEYGEKLMAHEARRAELKAAKTELKRALAVFAAVGKEMNPELNALLQTDLNALDGPGFGRFIASVFQAHGYAVMSVPRIGGSDLVVRMGPDKWLVRAERREGDVDKDAVREAHGARESHHCRRGVVVTDGKFTPAAEELGGKLGCLLVDGKALPMLVLGKVKV